MDWREVVLILIALGNIGLVVANLLVEKKWPWVFDASRRG